MLKANELSMKTTVANDKNLFEDVADSYDNALDVYRKHYFILDYEKILDTMIKFIEGYMQYTKSDDKDKYDGKVLSITRNFYDKMFTDKKEYRMVIDLPEFKSVMEGYLRKTKVLQKTMEDIINDDDAMKSGEMDSFIRMADNQYKKLAKVFKDDMKIYLWITTSGKKSFAYPLDNTTRSAFANKRTPVMHEYMKGDEDA